MTNIITVPTYSYLNRLEAELIRAYLLNYAKENKFVSVKLYGMINEIHNTTSLSEDHGWDSDTLDKVRIRRKPEGFYLDIPTPVEFKKESKNDTI
uniref:Uncharacterized protein n=1 Tax=Siphoviridae sp. ctLOE2 TaxID=2825454 RepID=A0A8S5PEI8_9CAUD|nr:MAG TPA: hypothetical protein [Siphoviridae sp. ctLOE2]